MTIALDTQVANQLYKKQLALEGKSVKAFEDEMLQEALGKLFDLARRRDAQAQPR